MVFSLTEFWYSLQTWEIALLVFFVLLFLIRVILDFLFYGRIAFYKNRKNATSGQFHPISVILTVRNEEANIKENLPDLLSYLSGRGEVVVVDDFSQDQTFTVLGLMREQYSNLKISSLNQEIRYSVKVSQNIGLKAASYEWVILISPQTGKFPENWLAGFQNYFSERSDVVLGYYNVKPAKGFFNHLYRIECFFQQIRSFSFLLNRMGFVVGEENIAFRKSKYFDQGGYGKKIKETYANLELIINDFIKKKNCLINLEPDSAIRLPVVKTKSDYREIIYKFRRIKSYLPFYKRAALAGSNFLKFLWLATSAGVFIYFADLRIYIAAVFVIKVILRAVIIKRCLNRTGEKKIFISSLIYDGLMPYLSFLVNGNTYRGKRPRKWKK